MRIVHFADTHIGITSHGSPVPGHGYNSRVRDFLSCLDKVVEHARQYADVVLFAGDAYKTRTPSPTYQREFIKRIRLMAQRAPVVLLEGNHDQHNAAGKASTLEIFRTVGMKNVTVVDRPQFVRVVARDGGELDVACMPYPNRRVMMTLPEFANMPNDELDRRLTEIASDTVVAMARKRPSPDIPFVLLAHCSVVGAAQGSEQQIGLGQTGLISRDALGQPAFDYVALGHIHKRQEIDGGAGGPIVYAGSTSRVDFGEEHEAKGFVDVEIAERETSDAARVVTWYYVDTPARPFATISVDSTGTTAPMEAFYGIIGASDLLGHIVRVRIMIDESRRGLVRDREIRKALADCGVNRVSSIEVISPKQVRESGGDALGRFSQMSPEEALIAWLESKGTSAERIDQLTQAFETIAQEAE